MRFLVAFALVVFVAFASAKSIIRSRRVQATTEQLVGQRLRQFASSKHYGKQYALARLHFEGHEHELGSSMDYDHKHAIKLDLSIKGDKDQSWVKTTDDQVIKTMDKGVSFSYAEMTALAGDYFGPKNEVKNIICHDTDLFGTRAEDKSGERFDDAFADIWANKNYGSDVSKGTTKANWQDYMGVDGLVHTSLLTQARNLLAAEKKGLKEFKDKLQGAEQENYGSAYYEQGGSWLKTLGMYAGMVANNYNPLAAPNLENIGNAESLGYNDDHWSDCANRTIALGHKKAVDEAFAAGKDAKEAGNDSTKRDAARRRLVKAFAISGFMSHFLSDRFSAGHIRTPFTVLRNYGGSLLSSPALIRTATTGLSGNVMHDEDNRNCLLVGSVAAEGKTWFACGDHRFFDAVNAQNRRRLHNAIEATVASVRAAFDSGYNGDKAVNVKEYEVPVKHLPSTTFLNAREASENTCPYFKYEWVTKKLMVRTGLKCLVTSIPRPEAAAKHNLKNMGNIKRMYGGAIQSTKSLELFPAQKDVQFEDLPAVGDCSYREITKDDLCTPAGRAAVDVSIDEFTAVNTCKGAQDLHYSQMRS